ncbi:hypothetical protein J31TS4_02810 [Paenibacillus sp. J31TS4]|uniref:ABC transporter permease subunit n=1 Tax=Paenibacillus sp. J31TS4 TaxID=2807195 RepID=UPI001B16372E|nr:ABC transporter permease subunit [Paenibacillus sp. J31TS4]GIP37001.1 hypothetical protein J31TS4_02810 [Paenibacillus sp. J31TS4]
MQGSFGHLIKQDSLRTWWTGKGALRSPWFWFYTVFILLVVVGSVTVLSLSGYYEPLAPLFIAFGLPYMAFMIGYNLFFREWKNGTVSWWLTLPYPRYRLMTAKYLAALLQNLLIYMAILLATLLLAGYSMLLDDRYRLSDFGAALLKTVSWYGISLSIVPFMTVFGLLTAVVMSSRLKPLSPLFWIGFSITGNMATWMTAFYTDNTFWNQFGVTEPGGIVVPVWFQAAIVPVSLVLAALFLWLSARIVDRQLTM